MKVTCDCGKVMKETKEQYGTVEQFYTCEDCEITIAVQLIDDI